jgi:hypothetical protein
MTEILLVFALIPCSVMMYARSLPWGGSEGACLQVQLDVELPKVVKGFLQVGDEATTLLRPHDDVVDIDLQVAPYLPFEVEMHTPPVCGPCILQCERHIHITKTTEGGDERGGGLVCISEGYLVITRVGI